MYGYNFSGSENREVDLVKNENYLVSLNFDI